VPIEEMSENGDQWNPIGFHKETTFQDLGLEQAASMLHPLEKGLALKSEVIKSFVATSNHH
jgi:hypothetical protein